MADNALIEKAVAFLKARNLNSRHDLAHIVERLGENRSFEDMDDAELKEIAKAALAQLAGPAPQKPAGQAARPATSAGVSTKRRDWGNTPIPSAPYRFITLEDQVAPGEKRPRNVPIVGGLSAVIDVDWVVESPLLIGAETNKITQPMRLPNGAFIIPGASLHGMIRAATEIVALGKLGFANLHHRYGVRDFDHQYYFEESSVSKVNEVHAGWLQRTADDQWQLTPLGNNWAHVDIEDLPFKNRTRKEWKLEELEHKYGDAGMVRGQLIDFTKTFTFSDVTFSDVTDSDVTDGPSTTAITQPKANGQPGTYVFSGKVPGPKSKKVYDYVFFDQPVGEPVKISAEKRELFAKLYSKPSKNRLEPDGNWKLISKTLEKGDRIAVFYVGDPVAQGRDFFFGLTRLFKVPHKRSVGEVVAESHAKHAPTPDPADAGDLKADFIQSLFGYVAERDELGLDDDARLPTDLAARKGRVAFGFAHVKPGQPTPLVSDPPIEVILMAPRASYAPFYLRGADTKDYSSVKSPKLAGRKRYLPRWPQPDFAAALNQIKAMGEAQLKPIKGSSSGGKVSDAVKSKLQFLIPAKGASEIRFTSKIRLHNVTEAELGAVLFALTHGGDPENKCRHMLGRAKAFGAGQVRVAAAELTVTRNDGGAAGETAHKRYLDAFIAAMRQTVPAYPNVASVREFLGSSIPQADAAQMDYMPLQNFKPIRDQVKPKKLSGDKSIRKNVPGLREALYQQGGRTSEDRLLWTPERTFWT